MSENNMRDLFGNNNQERIDPNLFLSNNEVTEDMIYLPIDIREEIG